MRDDPRSVGRFAWNTTSGQWYWDDGMYALHGYPAGAVTPSTQLVLEHKQDAHRARAAMLLHAAAASDRKYSNYHTILDVHGRQRTVLVVGESRADRSGPTVASRFSRGFMVDVTQDETDSTTRALQLARRSTASIQRSMGLLMGSLGLDEDAAFAVLARVSQHHNVKVRDLAARFMAAARSSAANSPRDLSQLLVDQAAALATERALRP